MASSSHLHDDWLAYLAQQHVVLDLADLPALLHCPFAAVVSRAPRRDDSERRLRDWLREGQTTELGTRDEDREVLRAVVAYMPDGDVKETDTGVVAKCELSLLWSPEGAPSFSYGRPRLPVGASLHVFYPTLQATRDTWAIAKIHAVLARRWCRAKSVTPVVVVFSQESKATLIQGFKLVGSEARLEEHKLRTLLTRAALALVSQDEVLYVPGEHCKYCVGSMSCPKIVKMASAYLDGERETLTEEDLVALQEVGRQLVNIGKKVNERQIEH